MALDNFKPTLWATQVIVDVDKALVFRNITSSNYVGAPTFGSIVKVNQIGPITVSNYTSTGVSWADVTDAQIELVIDQKKYFAFKIEDVDQVQANPNVMSSFMRQAAHDVADTVDQYIAALYSQAGVSDSTNLGSATTDLDVYADDMASVLSYVHRKLDESNAPRNGRWMVIPPWMEQYLVYSQIVNGTNYINDPNSPSLTSGRVANSYGFNFYVSNNVSNDATTWRVMAGAPGCIAYVGQAESIESMRLDDYIATGVRGLFVYGAKVVRPDHLLTAYLEPKGLSS